MINVLFVGQKPETVDFSDPSLPPGFNAEKINAGIALGVKKIEEHGWKGDTCMITPDVAGSAMLEKALTATNYDCVMIGDARIRDAQPRSFRAADGRFSQLQQQ